MNTLVFHFTLHNTMKLRDPPLQSECNVTFMVQNELSQDGVYLRHWIDAF